MQSLADGMLLYHGSYCVVEAPDLGKCALHKDFGRGFYLTSSFEQARSFAKISTSKAINSGIAPSRQRSGFVSIFEVRNVAALSQYCFADADKEWLHCIVAHRRRNAFSKTVREMEGYDVIAGKIANDNTNASITVYMAGALGAVDSEAAANLCIGLLLPERLQDQFCFRTEKSLRCLAYKGCKEIWL